MPTFWSRQHVKDRLSGLDYRDNKLKMHLKQLSASGSSKEESELRSEKIQKDIENIQIEKYIVSKKEWLFRL
jgi:hypothetical protein